MIPIANVFSTLNDFPPFPSAIMFTCGCNLRCKYCHNWRLVKDQDIEHLTLDDVQAYLDKASEFIDGLVVSGGEPTLHQYDYDFKHFLCTQSRRLLLKLDTNGTIPIEPKFLDLFYGISITLKPIGYYKSLDDIDTVKKNMDLANQICTYKELRITLVDNHEQFMPELDYISDHLDSDWKVTLNNAVKVDTGTLADDWNECNYDDLEELGKWVKEKISVPVQMLL